MSLRIPREIGVFIFKSNTMNITKSELHLIIRALDGYHDILIQRLTKEGYTLKEIEEHVQPIEDLILKIVLEVK